MSEQLHNPGPSPEAHVRNAFKGSEEPFFDSQTPPHETDLTKTLLRDVLATTCPQEHEWPHFIFTFSQTNIVGNGVLEASPDTRLTNVVRAIENVVPAASKRKNGESSVVSKTRTQTYVRQKTEVVRGVGSDEKMRRDEILPLEDVILELSNTLRQQNDPVMQALDQAERQFGYELSSIDRQKLKTEVLLSAKQEVIKNTYALYLKRYRVAGRNLLHFLMQS